MKKLFYLLLFVAATLAWVVTSCSDEPMPEPQEEEWVLPTDTAPLHRFGVLPGYAVYDTIYNCISVVLDVPANRITPIWFDTALVTTIRFIPPKDLPEFKLEPGEKFFFQLQSLGQWIDHYVPETKTGYSYATLRDRLLSRSEMDEDNYCIDLLSSSQLDFVPSGLSTGVYVFDKTVKIYVHILKDINGSGMDVVSTSNTVMQTLKSYFSGSGISFVLAGSEAHNYLPIAGLDFSTVKGDDPIFSLNRHFDGIDIYVVSHKNGSFYGEGTIDGLSEGLNGGSIIVFPVTGNTLGHEMGHSLGLYHTHTGTCKLHHSNTSGEIDNTPEYVDGSNSSTAGDLVTDTQADPNLWDSNGNYTGGSNAKDGKGRTYSPDPYNIMSYSSKASRFSKGQIERMHYFLYDKLSKFLVRPEIVGASHFSKSAQYTASGIQGSDYEWFVKRHKASSSVDDQPESMTQERYSLSTNPLTITSTVSEYLEIGITKAGSSTDFLSVMKVTTNAPSPITGSLMWTTFSNGTGWQYSTNMSWGDPLELYNDNTTIYLDYSDRAGVTLNNLNFSTVTATNRMLSGKQITVTKSDCARGYLKFRISDACGTSSGYFTLPVTVVGSYYALDFESGSITLTAKQASGNGAERMASTDPAPAIDAVKVIASESGNVVYESSSVGSVNKLTIDTYGWPSGDYSAIITEKGNVKRTIPFTL